MKKQLTGLFAILILISCSPSEEELFDEGVRKMESSEYQNAIEYFDRVLDKNPENTSAHNAKGVALYQQDKYDEAIAAFTASIALDDTSYKPFFNRGNAYLEKKEFKNAVLDYNKANGLDPNQGDVYYNRGLALLALEEYEDAIFDFDIVLQVNPDQPLVHFNRAKAQLANNDPVSAIESLVTTVDLDNRNGAAYYLLGVTQMSAFGQKEEGCANLKMALSLGFPEAKEWVDEFCQD
ncbi:tetratricopeptide repeat protein [Mongoliibacter ruber]|uniref:Tetratricopeptide repeat protein n=1 Tax=Mongoliibacter ruber TaxID=1750599 RepID=A0A2T0WE40_9BACT|nr:tetratricopeptide repeat protein [Mongoliibacter ruber]PRY84980.1 tetratricopeptide repeat protein [Mongoliibacter ruber]